MSHRNNQGQGSLGQSQASPKNEFQEKNLKQQQSPSQKEQQKVSKKPSQMSSPKNFTQSEESNQLATDQMENINNIVKQVQNTEKQKSENKQSNQKLQRNEKQPSEQSQRSRSGSGQNSNEQSPKSQLKSEKNSNSQSGRKNQKQKQRQQQNYEEEEQQENEDYQDQNNEDQENEENENEEEQEQEYDQYDENAQFQKNKHASEAKLSTIPESNSQQSFDPNSQLASKQNLQVISEAQQQEQQKIFMTQQEQAQPKWFTANDILFPGGKIAHLCRITDIQQVNYGELIKRYKFNTPMPIINLIGCITNKHSKILFGCGRCALHVDGAILTSGVSIGIENYCYSKGVKLIGVCPESKVNYVQKNKGPVDGIQLSAGHSHVFVLNKGSVWGSEARFKVQLGSLLAKGAALPRGIGIMIGDFNGVEEEVSYCIQQDWPILVLQETQLGVQLAQAISNGEPAPAGYTNLLKKGRWFIADETINSQELASVIYMLITTYVEPAQFSNTIDHQGNNDYQNREEENMD